MTRNDLERITTDLENGNGCSLSPLVRETRNQRDLQDQLNEIRRIHQGHRMRGVPGRYIPNLEITFETLPQMRSNVMVQSGTHNIFGTIPAPIIYKATTDHSSPIMLGTQITESCSAR